jgi:hypothetical protein
MRTWAITGTVVRFATLVTFQAFEQWVIFGFLRPQ